MKFFLIPILLGFVANTFGQTCDCLASIKFLENEYEQNLASYQHQVVQYGRQAEYQKHKNLINTTAAKITVTKDCIGLVAKYQSFFRDEHLLIDYK